MTAGLVLDGMIVLLLVPTVGFAFVLNRRLATLRRAQDEFRELLSGFNEATERAQTGVFQLKAAAGEVGGKLRDGVEKAGTAGDELSFLIDAGNRLLARQNRFRVEAEVTRDLFLAASGLLSPKVGGPSVRPPLPDGITALGYAGSIKWNASKGEDRYRRGLYTLFQRTVPYPMLMTFDAPDSNTTCTRRERSNTPLQALTLLNDPVFVECAQGPARRTMNAYPKEREAAIRHAFRLCLGREPSAKEYAILLKLYEDEFDVFRKDIASAAEFIAGDSDVPWTVQTAAMTAVTRTIPGSLQST